MFDDENVNDEITAEIGGNYVLCPQGNWVGSCCAMLVLGTVMESYKGSTPAPKKKIMLGFEVTSQKHIFKEEKGAEPFIIWREEQLTLNGKSNLRKLIESWGGKMTDEEAKVFKINDLVAAPGLINVIIDTNKEGKQRSKVLSVTQVPEGLQPLPMISEPLLFTYRTPFNQAAFDRIPAWIQKKMKTSDEYKAAFPNGDQSQSTTASTQPAQQQQQPVKTGFPFKKPL